MKNETDNPGMMAGNEAEALLLRLMQLKRYERPDASRMARNKQNIMRKVRHAHANRRKSIGDLLELNIPWFFAEPKYGIAALFVAFVGLQYIGINAQSSSRSTGIYTSNANMAALEGRSATVATNSASYPTLPSNYPLFDGTQKASDVMFVERLAPKK